MKSPCIRPCPNCPFRKDSPVVLGKGHGEVVRAGMEAGATFSCHQTILEDLTSGPTMMVVHLNSSNPKARQCAGSIVTAAGMKDAVHAETGIPLFDDLDQMVAYHSGELL